jgi:hypothetical protein
VGSSADLRCLQPRGSCLLRHLLRPVSRHISRQTAQARRFVSLDSAIFPLALPPRRAVSGSSVLPFSRSLAGFVAGLPRSGSSVNTSYQSSCAHHVRLSLGLLESRQMDAGLDPVLVVLCRRHGPLGVLATPRLNATAAFHGCLLWVSRSDAIFFHRRKSSLATISPVFAGC